MINERINTFTVILCDLLQVPKCTYTCETPYNDTGRGTRLQICDTEQPVLYSTTKRLYRKYMVSSWHEVGIMLFARQACITRKQTAAPLDNVYYIKQPSKTVVIFSVHQSMRHERPYKKGTYGYEHSKRGSGWWGNHSSEPPVDP